MRDVLVRRDDAGRIDDETRPEEQRLRRPDAVLAFAVGLFLRNEMQ